MIALLATLSITAPVSVDQRHEMLLSAFEGVCSEPQKGLRYLSNKASRLGWTTPTAPVDRVVARSVENFKRSFFGKKVDVYLYSTKISGDLVYLTIAKFPIGDTAWGASCVVTDLQADKIIPIGTLTKWADGKSPSQEKRHPALHSYRWPKLDKTNSSFAVQFATGVKTNRRYLSLISEGIGEKE